MVHVKYDKSLSTRGHYNFKRKEISILPSLKGVEKVYVLSHEFLHHVIHIYTAPQPNILDKIHDYIAFGHKYFPSFRKYRKAKKYEVYFRVCDIEIDKEREKILLTLAERTLDLMSEKEKDKLFERILRMKSLQKDAIRLLRKRIKKLEARGKKVS